MNYSGEPGHLSAHPWAATDSLGHVKKMPCLLILDNDNLHQRTVS